MLLITMFWLGTIALLIRQIDINADLKKEIIDLKIDLGSQIEDVNILESMLADKQSELENCQEIIKREGF